MVLNEFAMPVGLYEKALPADLSWEERLTKMAAAGYDFADISVDETESRLLRLDWPVSRRITLRRAIENSGVPILTMCLSAHRKFPLGSHSQELRQQGLDILRRAIVFAGDIGLRIVQVMGYDVFYETSDDETRSRFVESLELGVRWAGQSGVVLGLENVDNPFLESVAKGLNLVEKIDSPWFQLYPDMGNLAAAGYDPSSELALGKGHLVAVHVKDSLPGVIRGIPFETGIVPLTETFHSLAHAGFWGLLNVEMWADMDPTGDPFSTAVAARELVRKLVSQAWSDN